MSDREKVIKGLEYHLKELSVGKTCFECPYCGDNPCEIQLIADAVTLLKEQEPADKYEYHYDHTDCIWYNGTYHNPCPSTCSQYRDGWNDAMNYIFKDGKGYQPFKRKGGDA